jgi:hypothetical protein
LTNEIDLVGGDSNVSHLYLKGALFESRPGHHLSGLRFFIIFLSPSGQM